LVGWRWLIELIKLAVTREVAEQANGTPENLLNFA